MIEGTFKNFGATMEEEENKPQNIINNAIDAYKNEVKNFIGRKVKVGINGQNGTISDVHITEIKNGCFQTVVSVKYDAKNYNPSWYELSSITVL